MLQVTRRPTPNFVSGRPGSVKGICLHCTEGTAEGTLSWFASAKSEVSAHYHVRKTGAIDQFVEEADQAWATGIVDHPTAKLLADNPGRNPNSYLVSIEHEGFGDLTDAQRSTSLALIADIAARHNLGLDRYHILAHHEIRRSKSCPGKLDVDAHVAALHPPVVVADYPRVVFSPSLHDWLIVTRYVSDEEWYFTPLKSIVGGTRAGTALSQMPRTP